MICFIIHLYLLSIYFIIEKERASRIMNFDETSCCGGIMIEVNGKL
jgi:hypothetical protein